MKRSTLDEVLKPFGSCVILYETADNWGHWILLIRRGNVVELFDPYGYKPDEQRKFIPRTYLKKNYPHKHLVKLLLDSRYTIHYNNFELQDRNNKNVATCGRHVVMRALCKELDENQYAKLITEGIDNPDLFVTLCTMGLK